MAKIHPQISRNSEEKRRCGTGSLQRETFTIWMKSLVFHGNGCTVFNSKGEVVFRVDNYQRKCSNEVYLMDVKGRVLFSIKRKRLQFFGCWEGYEWIDSKLTEEKPRFRVRKNCKILSQETTCHVTLASERTTHNSYKITGLDKKSTFKITDLEDRLVAEVMQKQSSGGIPLGDDVLTLMVEPQMDKTLIMALVTVCGLINQKM